MVNTSAPRVSVVIAARNEARHLAEALESVLAQEGVRFEVLVIDDGSTDATAEIVRRCATEDARVRLLSNERNLGMGASFNRGLAAARADYVARMDGDDVCAPGRLAAQARLLDADPSLIVVGGHLQLIDGSGRVTGERRYPLGDAALKRRMFRFSPFAHPATMYRRRVVIDAGGYDPRFTPAEDLDLWLRLAGRGRFATADRVVLRYRLHTGSVTSRRSQRMQWQTLRVRAHAVVRYGFRPSAADVLFSIAQLAALPVPYRQKMRMFELYRRLAARRELAGS
jgi:glycosyltransferase involved in cell wall biosynthesis